MNKGLKLGLGAMLLCLPFLGTAAYAGEVTMHMNYAGTVTEQAFDFNSDTTSATLIDAGVHGTFGQSKLSVFSEFEVIGFCDGNADVYRMSLMYARSVSTFPNGDQLYGRSTGGWMCLNSTTGEFTGIAEGEYFGGTGRFADATGTFVIGYDGTNLTSPSVGFSYGSIYGNITGTLELD